MINVIKMDGTQEPFSEHKLRKSLRKAGADEETIEEILKKTRRILYNGIPTKTLFNFVFKEYKTHEPIHSCKYNLKNALLNLGLHGYAFEKFIGRILEHNGYSVELNRNVQGRYVTHEIDCDARKEKERLMVECKHHIHPWIGLDIKTALYVWARFQDVQDTYHQALLATNTTFTPHVIKYSRIGLQLLGWKYPAGNSLEFNIEKHKLYPVSILPLNASTIDAFAEKNIVTLKDFIERGKQAKLPLNTSKLNKLLEYAQQLSGPCD